MALIRVAQYSSTPGPVTDYQAQNAHLQAFTNQLMTQQFILDAGTDQPVIKQGCYVSHGGSLYVADADTPITGSPSDGSVYIRVSGTTSLTVEFVNDISGYAWNPVYTALTSGSYTLLPYLIVKASTVWTRYNFNPNNQSFVNLKGSTLAISGNATIGGTLGVTGAISGETVNTGQGDFKIGQNLRTTDAPRFIEIHSGYVYSAGDVSLMSKSSVLSTQGFVEIQTATFEWDERLLGIFRFGGTATTASSSYSPIFTVKLYKNGALIHTKVQTTSKATEGFYVDIPLQDGDEIKAGIYISNSVPAGTSLATLTSLYLAVQERPDSILEASQVEKVASRWTATF